MNKRCNAKTKYTFLACSGFVFLLVFSASAKAFHTPYHLYHIYYSDTIPASFADHISERKPADAFTFSKAQPVDVSFYSKDSIPSVFDFKATDSSVLYVKENLFSLHKEADIKNTDYDIAANDISYDKNTDIITANGAKDTTDNIYGKPTIIQSGSKSIMDSLRFNVKTKKGILKNTYYNEGEIFVKADIVKKIDSNAMFVKDARFTTCNLDPPHFDLHAFKLKMISGKLAVSGPAIPEFEGVPMPVVIPFGIYPLTKGRHSGLLPPTFDQNSGYGLGFSGLGYYKVINDYWDVTTRANIYSYGGYMVTVNPNYFKRYKYRGSLNLEYQFTKILNNAGITANEYTKSTTVHIGWSHSMDSKARPGVSFSANVNAGSTRYNSYIPNNPYQNFQNQLSSSITYAKNWDDGKYNLSVAANHNQNNNLHLINVQFPTVNFSMATINPFQKKEMAGKPKWYENLGISYNGTFLNQAAFYDTAFSFRQLLDTIQWGAQHQIPISLTLPAVGPLLFTPSISYSENWYSRKMTRQWDPLTEKVDTTMQHGFFTARQMSFGMSMNTRIFGKFNFKHGDVQLRHEIRPNISFNYQPDMAHSYYQNLQVDTSSRRIRVSQYEGNIVGSFGEGSFGGINFGLDNILQMKVLNKKDTTGDPDNQYKKISLIDGLSINSGYNLIADSLNWQPVNISFRSSLFNNKMNVNASMVIDQYKTDAYGQRINQLLWKEGKIGNVTSGNISMSTSFQSKKTDQRSDEQRIPVDPNMPYDQQQRQLNYVRDNPAEFVDFNIPWNLQASFAFGFFRVPTPDYKDFRTQVSSSLNLNGDFSLTPKWKAGGSIYFDIPTHKVQMMTLFVTREMHCWQMSINVSPIGRFKSFSIILNPKSGILRDLKINRSRSFYQ